MALLFVRFIREESLAPLTPFDAAISMALSGLVLIIAVRVPTRLTISPPFDFISSSAVSESYLMIISTLSCFMEGIVFENFCPFFTEVPEDTISRNLIKSASRKFTWEVAARDAMHNGMERTKLLFIHMEVYIAVHCLCLCWSETGTEKFKQMAGCIIIEPLMHIDACHYSCKGIIYYLKLTINEIKFLKIIKICCLFYKFNLNLMQLTSGIKYWSEYFVNKFSINNILYRMAEAILSRVTSGILLIYS